MQELEGKTLHFDRYAAYKVILFQVGYKRLISINYFLLLSLFAGRIIFFREAFAQNSYFSLRTSL